MIKLRLVVKSELGEVMHGPGREAALPPLPFTLSLPAGGCGRSAQREVAAAVAANDAWETPMRGHYGAGGAFGDSQRKERQKSSVDVGILDKGLWTCTSLIGLLGRFKLDKLKTYYTMLER